MVCASAEAIESCDEILIQILKHLPAKSLFRFKLVSKRWSSLISDPFLKSIWKPRVSGLFIQISTKKTCKTKHEYIKVEAKLPNSLQDNLSFLNSDGNSICVPCPERRSAWKEVNMFLAYDPSESIAYKLVAISSIRRSQIFVNMYSSESKSWKGIEGVALGDVCFNLGVYFDGSILWPALRSEESQCFNVSSEVFQRFAMPPLQKSNQQRKLKHFGKTNEGHLCLILGSSSDANMLFVHQMKRGQFNWSVKYHVDLTSLASAFHVLHIASKEDEVSSMILLVKGRAMSHEFKDKTYKELQKTALPDQKCLVVHQLIENPFCLLN
nr:F-box protein At5g07610-like [Coffea arabica]